MVDINDQWTAHMLRGEFEEAWALSDLVWKPPSLATLDGRRVLVRCEHGLGDTLQFIRYVPLLRRHARAILVHAQPRLVPLLRRMPEIDWIFTWEEPWPRGQYDCEIEIMDLPHLFRTTLDTVPGAVPYLSVDPGAVMAARAAYRCPGLRSVGLQLSCGDWDPRRSIPRSAVLPLVESIPGIALFDIEQPAAAPSTPDVTATAAAVLNLDLVITADTMVAHLAGALAAPVYVLLPYEANWRWMLDREDSPWYPTMRLFRQPSRGDWSTPAAQIATAIQAATTTGKFAAEPPLADVAELAAESQQHPEMSGAEKGV